MKQKKVFVPQYRQATDTLRKRILNGDYSLKAFPSERVLGNEFNMHYMTIRRAFHILEAENMLVRQPNRRMTVKRVQHGVKPHLSFGFLIPTFNSNVVEFWRLVLEEQARKFPCTIRPVLYMHWDDPVLMDSLKGFDGVFLNPIPEPVPPAVAEAFKQPEHPIVVLEENFSAYGLPSIQIFQPAFIQKLLDHLETLGHRCIGCLNTQPVDDEVNERVNQWRYWMAAHDCTGMLANFPVAPHHAPHHRAYEVMSHLLTLKRPETAWLCTTLGAAQGAMSAIQDHGLRPGRDLAVCCVNGEGDAVMCNPPLTALEPVNPGPYVSICLEWLMRGGKAWHGPLLMNPVEVPLMVRESTQPGAGRDTLAPLPEELRQQITAACN